MTHRSKTVRHRDKMHPSVNPLVLKTELLLEKLSHGKYSSQSTTLERFLAVLRQQEDTDVESALILLPVLSRWIRTVVVEWGTTAACVHPHAAAFALNVTALLSRNEKRFCQLNANNFFIKLVDVVKARQDCCGRIKVAYVRVLSAIVDHQSGVEWMTACAFWEDAIHLTLSPDDDVRSESTAFLAKLLDKTVAFDEDFCNGVVKRVLLPLGESVYKCLEGGERSATDAAAQKYLGPVLKSIGNLLEYFLDGILLDNKDFQVVLMFFKNFRLEERITDFMVVSKTESIVYDFGKVMFVMEFVELYVKVGTNSLSASSIKAAVDKIKNNYILSISKGDFEDVVEFSNFAQLFWGLMDKKIPQIQVTSNSSRKVFPLSDQLILLLLFPINMLLIKHSLTRDQLKELIREEFRDSFFYRMSKIASPEVFRACNYWRKYIFSTLRDNLYPLVNRCIQHVKKSRKYFSRDAAITVFQSLIYSAKDFIHATKHSREKLHNVNEDLSYFTQALEVLALLIEEFHITWKDSFEAIDVMVVSFDFLSLPRWSTEIIIQALNLINVAIAKYLSPNMALLLDNHQDSPVDLMGPLLYMKSLDDDPQVKKAAVEVMRTMTSTSRSQFPSLQKVLMDSELPTLVVKMSTCDGESFVRATAIKCLQEMIQVEEIWNNALKTEDLSQKMRDILLNETEGIVRVEAATFMCVAYEHQQFPKDSLDAIYETMIYSSTTDLHWEVKVRALNFWDKVIKNHLQNQGMIDGSFPNVTFSKEHRKIVTLTDSEIRKRLLKVLGQLSAIGCLGVLTAAIKDDCDMEVSKTAVKITQKLVDLLKKYAVGGECSGPTSPIPTESGMSMSSGISVDESMDSPRSSQPDLNEEIIEQIVNAKDASLLKGVYAPSDYGSVSNYDFQVRKIVTPTEFLQFTHQDLNNIIAEKKKWLNGIEDLGSLLDDMLKTYDEDVNSMDCY